MNDIREKALCALLTSGTQEEAGKKVGISARHIRRFLSEPEFSQRYQQGLHDLISEAEKKGKQSLSPALDTLLEIAQDKKASSGSRVNASRSLLEYSLKLTEIDQILTTLQRLEESRGIHG